MDEQEAARRALERLDSAGRAEMEGESMVGGCAATTCLYNLSRHCTAGAISVAFVNGLAQCATFTPREATNGLPAGVGADASGGK